MCLFLNCKIVHCEFHVFSFSFVHAPVCANCKNDSCNILFKKKNKKKKKNDPYSGMGEKCQSYATKTPLSIFSLGKGRESLRLQTLHKKKSALSALPPSTQIILIQTLCGRRTPKLTKIDHMQFTLPQLLHLSSNRRVRNLQLYFQFTTPARELTHRMKFILPRKTRILETPCFFTT